MSIDLLVTGFVKRIYRGWCIFPLLKMLKYFDLKKWIPNHEVKTKQAPEIKKRAGRTRPRYQV